MQGGPGGGERSASCRGVTGSGGGSSRRWTSECRGTGWGAAGQDGHPERHPRYLLLQAAAARGGQILLLQRVAVVQRETQHLVLQFQHLVEVGTDLVLHAAVVGLQLAQALRTGLGLAQLLLQLLALPQQSSFCPFSWLSSSCRLPMAPARHSVSLDVSMSPAGRGSGPRGSSSSRVFLPVPRLSRRNPHPNLLVALNASRVNRTEYFGEIKCDRRFWYKDYPFLASL